MDLSGEIAGIKLKMQENNEMIAQILNLMTSLTTQRIAEAAVHTPNLTDNFIFPLASEEDLKELDAYLLLPDGIGKQSFVSVTYTKDLK